MRLCRFRATPVLFLFCLLCAVASSAAEPDPSPFAQANRLYEQGKFSEAISLYETMLKSGGASPGVLFNLGNACFKNGQFGRAIFNYRRAETLAPRDPDIQANLRFARDRVSGSASIQPPVWRRFVAYFTTDEITRVTALLFWLWLSLLAAIRFRPALRPSLRGYTIATFVLLIFAAAFLAANYFSIREPAAIALQHQVIVHLGPLSESQAAFTVPDGTELRVEARRGDWLQVMDRSNRSGWVDASQVAVYP